MSRKWYCSRYWGKIFHVWFSHIMSSKYKKIPRPRRVLLYNWKMPLSFHRLILRLFIYLFHMFFTNFLFFFLGMMYILYITTQLDLLFPFCKTALVKKFVTFSGKINAIIKVIRLSSSQMIRPNIRTMLSYSLMITSNFQENVPILLYNHLITFLVRW